MMEVFDGVVNLYQTCYSGGQYVHTLTTIVLVTCSYTDNLEVDR